MSGIQSQLRAKARKGFSITNPMLKPGVSECNLLMDFSPKGFAGKK